MMAQKFLIVRFIALVLCVLMGFNPKFALAQVNSDIEFKISSNKAEYIPNEPVIVTSTITNKSPNVLSVKEPSALAFVSAFTLETDEGVKKQVFNHVVGFGRPAFWAANVELQPKESKAHSCELSWQINRNLQPGKYILHARYYRSEYGAADFKTNILEAQPIKFSVVEGSEEDKQVQGILTAAQSISNSQDKKAALRDFLVKHPDSVLRMVALSELLDAEVNDENNQGALDVYRQILKENISDSKREHTLFFAADTSANLGDIKGALAFLKDSKLPNSIVFKKRLEKKLAAQTAQALP